MMTDNRILGGGCADPSERSEPSSCAGKGLAIGR